jgi:hypothetical protein
VTTKWWLAAAVVVAVGWVGPAAAQDKPYVWKEGKVQVLFPDTPKESKEKLELARDNGKVVFMVTYNVIEALAKAPPDTHKLIFNSTRDNLAKSLNGKLVGEKELKLEGAAGGREFLVETALLGIYRTRIYIVGDRLYQQILMAPKDVATGKEGDTFFDSFKLIK